MLVDKRTKYGRIQLLINELDPNQTYHLEELKSLIRRYIASNEKSVVETLHMMQDMKVISELEHFKFKINKDGNL